MLGLIKKKNSIIVTNIGGPLKHLQNNWQFKEKLKNNEVILDIYFEI